MILDLSAVRVISSGLKTWLGDEIPVGITGTVVHHWGDSKFYEVEFDAHLQHMSGPIHEDDLEVLHGD